MSQEACLIEVIIRGTYDTLLEKSIQREIQTLLDRLTLLMMDGQPLSVSFSCMPSEVLH